MPEIPAEAVRAVAEILRAWEVDQSGEGVVAPVTEFDTDALELLTVAAPFIAEQARREAAEHIASLLTAVDPVEWALAGQRAGQDAARIAREAFPKGADHAS